MKCFSAGEVGAETGDSEGRDKEDSASGGGGGVEAAG